MLNTCAADRCTLHRPQGHTVIACTTWLGLDPTKINFVPKHKSVTNRSYRWWARNICSWNMYEQVYLYRCLFRSNGSRCDGAKDQTRDRPSQICSYVQVPSGLTPWIYNKKKIESLWFSSTPLALKHNSNLILNITTQYLYKIIFSTKPLMLFENSNLFNWSGKQCLDPLSSHSSCNHII